MNEVLLESHINITPIEIERQKYIESIKFYFIFLSYGTLGGIFFNMNILNFDLMINGIISPLIYYHSPRHILKNMSNKQFIFIYTPSYIVGLCFRFLDNISILNTFNVKPSSIDTPLEIILASCISFIIFFICIYYILLSKFPVINAILFIFYVVSLTLASYYFYMLNGIIHYHHYIIGLAVMLLSKNSNSTIVTVIHAISYGIYIDGISRWGFAPIYSM